MYKYTVTGLEEREAKEAAAAQGGEADESSTARLSGDGASSQRDPGQCRYHLKGIVVHSGTAFAGHYYSYIKVSTSCLRSIIP